ncbi:MAG: hypothetical protein FWF63_11465 [Fibromonadales bacterium]|nr:hypothetical protein [Fibromonadales bacterium]
MIRFLILSVFFLACSQNFTNSHKFYSSPPAKTENVGVVQLDDAFMLTRTSWFAEKLNIQGDSIYDKLEKLTDSIILSELSKSWNVSAVSKKDREQFSKETLKMDKTIFIKTRFPEQGVEIGNSNYLFIIHEYTVGGDLDAENFYDYTKANVEMSQKKKFHNFSIIATFTLWDNKRQIPLRSGIISVQTPIKEDVFNMDIFVNTTKQAVAECIKKL